MKFNSLKAKRVRDRGEVNEGKLRRWEMETIKSDKVHGIAITERKTGKLVDFIKCGLGRQALSVLGGVRINLDKQYKADETFITEEEYTAVKTS